MKVWPLILIVDDSATDVQIISELLNSEYRIKVARNGADALAVAEGNPLPDLILLDMIMPDMDGFEVFGKLRQSALTRGVPVVFLTAVHDAEQEVRALNLQAADYITKPYSVSVVRARIRNAMLSKSTNGDQRALTSPAMKEPLPHLGKRELEVMALIAQGMTSAEIGTQLFIAKGTVEVHRLNIMRKLGVRNIAGLVKVAIRNGLLAP